MSTSSLWKEILLGIFFVVVSMGTFTFWHSAVSDMVTGSFQTSLLVAAGVGLLLVSILFALVALFVRNRWVRFVALGLGGGLPFFLAPATPSTLVLLAVAFFFMLFAAGRIHREYDHSFGLHLSKVLRTGLPVYLSVVCLIASAYYLAAFHEVRSLTTLIPQPVIEGGVGRISTFVGLPKIDPRQTVDEFLVSYIEERLGEQRIPVREVPRAQFVELVRTQRIEFSSQLGVQLDGHERVGDVLYIAVTERIVQVFEPIKEYIPMIAAAAFFLGLKALMLPLYYLALLVLWGLMKILIAVGFFRKETKEIEVEKLTL